MATKSFYEDLVIDTPEAAENFSRFVEEGKTYVVKGPILEEADPEFIQHLIKKYE